MKPILEVQGISKKFKIQHEQKSYLSLRDSLTSLLTKEKSREEEFWALKDVSFEVYPGESVGIIGRNGAGKSTLLKILSKITPPSAGKIISRGRIASLLEVGTGFHPELTGRENIYLNGSILGLKKAEINKQFDAIVDFSGVEKFLDTPLKHYSSGMQLRLAFAVAAHLEPEILIIDEVLAVGDSEFQKKCIGKMNDVSKSGRTILFVSHNMGVLQQLCKKAYILTKGEVDFSGPIEDAILRYISKNSSTNNILAEKKDLGALINGLELVDNNGISISVFGHKNDFKLRITFLVIEQYNNLRLGFAVLDQNKNRVFTNEQELTVIDKKKHVYEITIPGNFLVPGNYSFVIAIHIPNIAVIDSYEDILPFEIIDQGHSLSIYEGTDIGKVLVDCKWDLL